MSFWLGISLILNGVLLLAFIHSDLGWSDAVMRHERTCDEWRRTIRDLEDSQQYAAALERELDAKPYVFPGDEWKN